MRVHLRVIQGADQGRAFTFDRPNRVFIVGRGRDAHIRIENDPSLSRHHVLFQINPPNVYMQDLGGRNGTFLNEDTTPVREAMLRHGDQLRCGQTAIQVEVEADNIHELDTERLGGPVVVRCGQCGAPAEDEAPRPPGEDVQYLCLRCQDALLRMPPLPPDYELDGLIGRGSMGAVFRVKHRKLGRRSAAKIVLPRAAMAASGRERFLREAREQACLSHPNVVQVYDLVEVRPGVFCLIMEYVDGESAFARRKRAGDRGLPPSEAVEIVAEALLGLAHAHEHGVVHRDIKPGNLLLGPSGSAGWVKLTDFGLAKSYQTTGASGFTRTGEQWGTLRYMAPDQMLNFKAAQPAADIYSMGVTLYLLLCGTFPHDYPPGVNEVLVVLNHPIVPLRQRNADLPPALCAAVECALQREPADRFRTAADMRRSLLAAV